MCKGWLITEIHSIKIVAHIINTLLQDVNLKCILQTFNSCIGLLIFELYGSTSEMFEVHETCSLDHPGGK